jgi:hypothetical protein
VMDHGCRVLMRLAVVHRGYTLCVMGFIVA